MTVALIAASYVVVVVLSTRFVTGPWWAREFPLSWAEGEGRATAVFFAMTLLWVPCLVLVGLGRLIFPRRP